MTSKPVLIAFLISNFLVSAAASAENYDDCVLKGLDGVTSDFIAKQVVTSCENKYIKSASNEPAVPSRPKLTTIEVGHSTKWKIPVPAGDYVKTGSATDYSASVPLVYEIFENVENGTLKSLIWVMFTKNPNGPGWAPDPYCNRKNFHYVKKISNYDGGKQECIIVNHWRIVGGGGGAPAYEKSLAKTKQWHGDNNIPIPSTLIVASSIFARENILSVRVGFNPEFDGFPPPSESEWSSNDWHQDRIIGDKKRTDYIQSVKAFAIDMHKQLALQFKR